MPTDETSRNQVGEGGNWRARASYEAIEVALRSMRQQSDAERLTRIAIPRIGVGYGGLSWKKVRAIRRWHAASRRRTGNPRRTSPTPRPAWA